MENKKIKNKKRFFGVSVGWGTKSQTLISYKKKKNGIKEKGLFKAEKKRDKTRNFFLIPRFRGGGR